jgi:hypothetical protein
MGRTAEQERLRKREYRARKRAEAAGDAVPGNVTSILSSRRGSVPVGEFEVFESAEAAVRYEIQLLPAAAERPSDVSAAIRLAQILDDRNAPGRVQAAEKLRSTMDALRGGGSNSGSHLKNLREARSAR